MASQCLNWLSAQRYINSVKGCGKGSSRWASGERSCCSCVRSMHLVRGNSFSSMLAQTATRLRGMPLRASEDPDPANRKDEDDELDKLLGIGRYRSPSGGFFSSDRFQNSSSSSSKDADELATSDGAGSTSEVADTLADVMQMEVRRVRARQELEADLEERKTEMRAIGEEMKAALAREYELDRLRTEMGANYVMSDTFQALDDVEAEVQRIKQQLQADKAELAAWEAQTAEDRSRGLFFRSLYKVDKDKTQPKLRDTETSAAAAESTKSSETGATSSSSTSSNRQPWDPEAVAAAAERPLSAASRTVRAPLRLYLFSYLSAFLALLVVNDIAVSFPPHVARDALYGLLSAGLGFVAVKEREALADAQAAILEDIRRRSGARSRPDRQAKEKDEGTGESKM